MAQPTTKTTRTIGPTMGASTYVDPEALDWTPSAFAGIEIKVLYQDKESGALTCLLKWQPGAALPMHKHQEIEQTYVLEGSFYDHEGICRAGEYVWRKSGSYHEAHSDEGALMLAVFRKPNLFRGDAGFADEA